MGDGAVGVDGLGDMVDVRPVGEFGVSLLSGSTMNKAGCDPPIPLRHHSRNNLVGDFLSGRPSCPHFECEGDR